MTVSTVIQSSENRNLKKERQVKRLIQNVHGTDLHIMSLFIATQSMINIHRSDYFINRCHYESVTGGLFEEPPFKQYAACEKQITDFMFCVRMRQSLQLSKWKMRKRNLFSVLSLSILT